MKTNERNEKAGFMVKKNWARNASFFGTHWICTLIINMSHAQTANNPKKIIFTLRFISNGFTTLFPTLFFVTSPSSSPSLWRWWCWRWWCEAVISPSSSPENYNVEVEKNTTSQTIHKCHFKNRKNNNIFGIVWRAMAIHKKFFH